MTKRLSVRPITLSTSVRRPVALGGEVVYQGDVDDLKTSSNSYTVRYLTGEDQIEVPLYRRPWNNYIEVKGARKNNLKGIDVKFPLNVMTVCNRCQRFG